MLLSTLRGGCQDAVSQAGCVVQELMQKHSADKQRSKLGFVLAPSVSKSSKTDSAAKRHSNLGFMLAPSGGSSARPVTPDGRLDQQKHFHGPLSEKVGRQLSHGLFSEMVEQRLCHGSFFEVVEQKLSHYPEENKLEK